MRARIACTGIILAFTACTAASPGPPSTAPSPTPVPASASAPEWRPRDRWVYEWTSGAERGTKTVEVIEIRTISEARYYIVRLGDVEHYYTMELHWAAAIRDSRVEARMAPPQPWFMWPLVVARQWEHRATFEDRQGSRSLSDRFSVAGSETIEVPAGRFQASKVVRQSDRRDSDEYWYAAEVRWYVRWIGQRGDVTFEERLKEYQAAPR